MSIPRALTVGPRARLVAVLVVTMALPITTSAGGRGGRRSFADTLRHGPGVSNHPVGVAPSSSITVPDGWPLDANGTITCLTCHVAIPWTEGRSDPRLRGFDAEPAGTTEFCMKCHAQSTSRTAATMHWLAVAVAHVKEEQTRPERSGSRRPGLDRETAQCLGCHDGVSAGESRNPTPWNRGHGYTGSRERNHPVGAPYPTRTPEDYDVPFRPANLLPKEVRLPDGKVGCVSCHDLYAGTERLLTVPIRGSGLCLTCHDLK